MPRCGVTLAAPGGRDRRARCRCPPSARGGAHGGRARRRWTWWSRRARAGALAFLAGGYKTAAALAEEMAAVRAAGVDTFGVNLFVPGAPTRQTRRPGGLRRGARGRRRRRRGGPRRGPSGTTTTTPPRSTRSWPRRPPRSASPSASLRPMLSGPCRRRARRPAHRHDARGGGPGAAGGARRAGLQGAEAGAHRGSLVNADRADEDRPVRALLAAVRRRTLVPLVAGGRCGRPRGRGRPAGPGGRPGAGRARRSCVAPRAARRRR